MSCIYLKEGLYFFNLYRDITRVSGSFMGNIVLRLVIKCGIGVIE